MKKYLILLIVLFGCFTSANALEIKSLGLKAGNIDGLEISTRENKDKLYFMYAHDVYAYGENDDVIFYIRAIKNPNDFSFDLKTEITDVIFDLLSGKGTNQYSYIANNDYKWVKIKYTQENFNILEYYIGWKDLFITVTVQSKQGEFSREAEYVYDSFIHAAKLSGEGKTEITHVLLSGIDTYQEPRKKNYILLIILCSGLIAGTYWYTRYGNGKKK